MQFLKTLFWIVLTVVVVAFAMNNWITVTIQLWGAIVVDAKLPVLLISAFLIGLLPTLIVHRATRWRLRRRIDQAERALAGVRGETLPPPVIESDGAPLPPGGAPFAAPPALS